MDPIKVFLVEDERIVREGLRDMIPWEQYGFVFAGEAQDGEVALPMVRRIRPDILITDIKMPFMDGLSLSRLVNRELPDTRIIILSGYDDFEYAQQAIELQVDQYLLKPITKANAIKALEQTKKRIEEEQDQKEYLQTFTREARKYEDYSRRAFFEKLVSGALSVQEIYEQAEKLEIELDAESYNIVLFSIHTPGNVTGYSEGLSRMEETLLRYFIRIPDLLLFRSSLLSHAVLIKGSVEEVRTLTAQCVEVIRQHCSSGEFPVDWHVAVGTPVSRLSGLHRCYADASHALAFRHLLPRQHVLTTDLLRQNRNDDERYGAVDSGKLDPLIITGFVEKGLLEEIGDFVSEFFGDLGDAVDSMMFRHYLILSARINAISAVRELGLDREELVKRLPPAEIDLSGEDLKAYFRDVLYAAIRLRDEETQKQSGDLVTSALQYIDQHYTEESISLNSTAKAINVSTNYLSAIFSQSVGQSFVEYLTQKRMTRAKQFLRQSNKRTGEIAAEVGYRDPRYFSFVFKKTQGCTPREYRAGDSEHERNREAFR